MSLLTKNTKVVAEYQQWTAADISNGDIIGVYESLGNRNARSVTIETVGGPCVVRFNVSKKIYKPHGMFHNSWVGLGQGNARRSSILVDEVKIDRPDVTLLANSSYTWLASEIAIHDIEMISKSSGVIVSIA